MKMVKNSQLHQTDDMNVNDKNFLIFFLIKVQYRTLILIRLLHEFGFQEPLMDNEINSCFVESSVNNTIHIQTAFYVVVLPVEEKTFC